MPREVLYILTGYGLGNILFAQLFGYLFTRNDIRRDTPDGNPGATNAFKNGGFICGSLSLLFDISKGFLPVFLYMGGSVDPRSLPFVIAAPVLGHTYPALCKFKGGKGVAVTFGVLLGLFPLYYPVAVLAAWFLCFCLLIVIRPDYYKTIAAYVCTLITLPFLPGCRSAAWGFLIIFSAVMSRMLTSHEKKEQFEVRLIWKH